MLLRMAVQSIRENPQLNELGKVLAEAYGIDMSDMDGLIDAVKNGRVKNDEYYETLAAQRGISVKTAREMDRMEGQLQRANAEKQQAEQLRLARGAPAACSGSACPVGSGSGKAEKQLPGL